MLSLEALRVFLAVADHGSFSEAGRQLHITQSAVSQAIHSLENSLELILFLRTGRNTRLTPNGQVLAPMARELLTSARRIEQTMFSLQDEIVGELSIGCTTASGKYILPGYISQFRKQYPRVRIDIIVKSRETVLNKLLSGGLALGVSSKIVENYDLEYKRFFRDDVILIVSANHAWARYRRIYPDDLLDEALLLREETSGTREVVLEGLLQQDITFEMLNISMVIGNAEAIAMAVEDGLGVAFISRLAAARGIALGRIVEVEVIGMSLSRSIYLVRNRRQPLNRAQSEFWNFIPGVEGNRTEHLGSAEASPKPE